MKNKCILFDIDGTLVDTRGAGREAFASAIHAALHIDDDLRHISFAGATDLNILHTLCEKHGILFNHELADTFFEFLSEGLASVLHESNVVLLPGVKELIHELDRNPDILQGLLTGNAERCARIKLAPHDLNQFFSFGSYGDEFAVRSDIACCAKDRALRLSDRNISRFIVIGDTPLDILAARSIDAVSIVTATGKYNMDELTAAGADYVFPDLSNTGHIVELISQID